MPHQRARNSIQSPSRALRSDHHRFAVRIAYDGSFYRGFQSQHSLSYPPSSSIIKSTIQDQIELRLRNLLNRQVRILSWGRTDAGVHATGAVFTVDLNLEEVKRLSRFQLSEEKSSVVHSGESKKSSPVENLNNNNISSPGVILSKNEEKRRRRKHEKQRLLQQLQAKEKGKRNAQHDNSENNAINDECLRRAANALLSTLRIFSDRPGSITAQNVIPSHSFFDPRFSSRWKRYVYYISHGRRGGCINPFLARYAWQIDCELDLGKNDDGDNRNNKIGCMNQAAMLLNGKHNFEWLSVVQEGETRNPILELELRVKEIPLPPPFGDMFSYAVAGSPKRMVKISATCDYFLYRMVRRIVGVLVAVGTSQIDVSILEKCIKFHDEAIIEKVNAGTTTKCVDDSIPALAGTAFDDISKANGTTSADESMKLEESDTGNCKNNRHIDSSLSSSVIISNSPVMKEKKNSAYIIPQGLLQTAPANGLYLEHIEYDFPI